MSGWGLSPKKAKKVQFCLVGWAACSLAQSPCGHSPPSSKKSNSGKKAIVIGVGDDEDSGRKGA
jgi:hypothetical protein